MKLRLNFLAASCVVIIVQMVVHIGTLAREMVMEDSTVIGMDITIIPMRGKAVYPTNKIHGRGEDNDFVVFAFFNTLHRDVLS